MDHNWQRATRAMQTPFKKRKGKKKRPRSSKRTHSNEGSNGTPMKSSATGESSASSNDEDSSPSETRARKRVRNHSTASSSTEDEEEEEEVEETVSSVDVCIATYNVLADHLCRPTWFPYRPKAELKWEKRRDVLKQTILGWSADIVCLQEVQAVHGPEHMRGNDHHVDYFNKFLRNAGYSGAYCSRRTPTDTSPPGKHVGNCVYWRDDRFTPVLVTPGVAILKTIAKECEDRDLKSRFASTESRGTVATMVALQETRSKRVIVVCTTHLPAPRNDRDADIKLQQLVHVRAVVESLREFVDKVKPGVDLVVLAGDLNAPPDTPVMEFLQSGSCGKILKLAKLARQPRVPFVDLKTRKPAYTAPPLRLAARLPAEAPRAGGYLTSALKEALQGSEPKYTNLTSSFVDCLDYIMYACPPSVVTSVRGSDPGALVEDPARFLPDPTKGHGSDHVPVVCTFTLTASPTQPSLSADDATTAAPAFEPYVVAPAHRGASEEAEEEREGGEEEEEEQEFTYIKIRTENEFDAAMDRLETCTSLVFDAEGVSLSRHGAVAVVMLKPLSDADMRPRGSSAYVVDILSLGGNLVFGPDSKLRRLLESESVLKYVYDCRTDSDALFHQFNVRLARVMDLQVWYQAVRPVVEEETAKRIASKVGSRGDPLPRYDVKERSKDYVPFVRSMTRVAPEFLPPKDAKDLARMRGGSARGEEEWWGRRPLADQAWEFAASAAHTIDLMALAMMKIDISPEMRERVEGHSQRMLRVFRNRPTPVSLETDKVLILGQVDLMQSWEDIAP